MTLRSMLFAAASVAVAASAVPASAADLGLKDSPYDDPRYSDMYGQPPPPRYAYPVPAQPVYPPIVQPHYAPAPVVPPYRYDGRYAGECLPRHVIRDQLASRGWQDFHDPQVMGNVVHIRARRPSGRIFDLTVDRCSGVILNAQLIDDRSAYAPPLPPPDWRYQYDGGRRY